MDATQLDGVSLIVGALAAGAADGLKGAAKDAVIGTTHAVGRGVQAARERLVALLKGALGTHEDAMADLNVYLRRPSPENAEMLSSHILAAGLNRDETVLAAARELIGQAGPTAIGPGSVAGTIINSINNCSGHSHVGGVQNFGVQPGPQ